MSQKAKRGSITLDDKEKGRTDSPVKDMKKKAAANAEKERAAAVKEKDSGENDKQAQKPVAEQKKIPAEQKKTVAEQKKTEQNTPTVEHKSPAGEKMKAAAPTVPSQNDDKVKDIPLPAEKKEDAKSDKTLTPKQTAALEPEKSKQNGKEPSEKRQNGGAEPALNGAANGDPANAAPAPEEEDDQFPELAYDDTSDTDAGRATPDALGRSSTRRDQVKATRTPETPRPASQKLGGGEAQSEENGAPGDAARADTKLLKLRDEFSASPMRLRSSDRSTPEPGRPADADDKDALDDNAESKNEEESVGKRDTNFSKSRIKVSPYRRSTRLQDSMLANYTGNNTTMEMDITESFTEQASGDSSYALGLRSIRGRRSYKPAAELALRTVSRPTKTPSAEVVTRPTVQVVGRKRKPLEEDDVNNGTNEQSSATAVSGVKRMRLLERVVSPFASLVRRRTVASSTPLPARRSQPIVGINSDLPLHVHVATLPLADSLLDPESIKMAPDAALPAAAATVATPPGAAVEVAAEAREDSRQKCVVM